MMERWEIYDFRNEEKREKNEKRGLMLTFFTIILSIHLIFYWVLVVPFFSTLVVIFAVLDVYMQWPPSWTFAAITIPFLSPSVFECGT